MSRFPSRLSTEQWQPVDVTLEPAAEAVVRGTGNFAVMAGPGAGKTELLAQKAVFLFQTGECAAPRRILAISFKKDAAKNLKERIEKRCLPEHAARFDSLTFDAFAKGLLDRFRNALPENSRPLHDYQVDTKNQSDQNQLNFLSFPMISRLVIHLLQTNPLLVRTLRLTYSHLFLDEFQDATERQYLLVKTIFLGSNTRLTSVGDNKQRIMKWAGAVPGIFGQFVQDFSATTQALLFNHRSVPELVRIQHALARRIDPAAPLTISQREPQGIAEICAVWLFQDPEQQAHHLAYFISQELASGGNPRDFVLLVRQKADQLEQELKESFASAHIHLRNEARLVGGVAIQDVLTEPLTELLLGFLKLGAVERNSARWQTCADLFSLVRGYDRNDEQEETPYDTELSSFIKELRRGMTRIPDKKERLRSILRAVLDFAPEAKLRANVPQYRQGDWFDKVHQGCLELLWESCQNAPDWETVFERFEGLRDVPLMTIHKSKGLEFPTVIFVGLDDQQFWSMGKDQEEGLSTFFVAFTRAEERVFITSVSRNWQNVMPIYHDLSDVGVPCVSF